MNLSLETRLIDVIWDNEGDKGCPMELILLYVDAPRSDIDASLRDLVDLGHLKLTGGRYVLARTKKRA